jgi:hypothetical protein
VKGKRRQEKVDNKNVPRLRVVEIRYVPTPSADLRLSRAVDILLAAAADTLEGSLNAKKEVETPQNSPLVKAMDGKDEYQSSKKKAGTPQGNTRGANPEGAFTLSGRARLPGSGP